MNATAGVDTSDRYEKVDSNVFRMKAIGPRPKRRILTNFGRLVAVATTGLLLVCLISLTYHLLK